MKKIATLSILVPASVITLLLASQLLRSSKEFNNQEVNGEAAASPLTVFEKSSVAQSTIHAPENTKSVIIEPTAAAAVKRLALRLEADLYNSTEYNQYLVSGCEKKSSNFSVCNSLLSDALYATTSRSLNPFVEDEAQRLNCADANTAHYLKEGAQNPESDSVQRMTSLRLLLTACDVRSDGAFPLQDSTYESLAQKPAAEAQLFLLAHGQVPLSSEQARQSVAALAENRDVEVQVRTAALLSLSHTSEDAKYLSTLVQTYLNDMRAGVRPLFPQRAVAQSLGGCGLHCRQILSDLAANEEVVAQELVHAALGFVMGTDVREQLESELKISKID